MKRFFIFAALCVGAFSLASCEYDDSNLWNKVDEMQEQIDTNTEDIATLSALVDALNRGKVITNVEQTEDGYTLTFSDGSTVSLRHGEKGDKGDKGDKGEDGTSGDSIFESIEETDTEVIITLTDGRVIVLPKKQAEEEEEDGPTYELRVLTFEDGDYRGNESNAASYWSDFIPTDTQYGNGNGHHAWYDEGNTFLSFTPSETAMFPGYGGHALSNYVGSDLSQGDYTHDLQAYNVEGGANGSKNFCVHFGYADESNYGMQNELVYFEFGDGEARVIDHMWVTNTTYVYNLLENGDGWQVPTGAGEDSWYKIVAYGYDENNEQSGEAEFFLWTAGRQGVQEWTKWDLSSLGKVTRVEFNLVGSDDLYGDYGLGVAGYFAYDDVAVRFDKE